MMRHLAALVILLLVGCGAITRAQADQLAQGRADVEASRKTTQPEAKQTLQQAAESRFMAGTANMELPPPAYPADSLVSPAGEPVAATIQQERGEAKAAEESPPGGLGWRTVGGIALSVCVTALSLLRLSPGAFGTIAGLAHSILAPKQVKEAKAAVQSVLGQSVAYGYELVQLANSAGLAPQVEAIKGRFAAEQERLGIRAQVNALLRADKDARLVP